MTLRTSRLAVNDRPASHACSGPVEANSSKPPIAALMSSPDETPIRMSAGDVPTRETT